MRRFHALAAVCLGVVCCASIAAAESAHAEGAARDGKPPKSPRRVIASFHETLIEAMKAGRDAGFEGRAELLGPAIRSAFDIELIARLTLASHWSELSEPQRQKFVDTLRRFTVATYASRFKAHDGQAFEIRTVQEQRPSLRIVRAAFIDGDGEERPFDYQLRRSEQRWRVVNVAVEGVSDLAVKRAQYVDLVEREGFDALIDRLEKKIRTMREGSDEDE